MCKLPDDEFRFIVTAERLRHHVTFIGVKGRSHLTYTPRVYLTLNAHAHSDSSPVVLFGGVFDLPLTFIGVIGFSTALYFEKRFREHEGHTEVTVGQAAVT